MKVKKLHGQNQLLVAESSLKIRILWIILVLIAVWLLVIGAIGIPIFFQDLALLISSVGTDIFMLVNYLVLTILSWICFYIISIGILLVSLSRLGKERSVSINQGELRFKTSRWFLSRHTSEISVRDAAAIQIIQDDTSDHATLFIKMLDDVQYLVAERYGKEGIDVLNELGTEIHEIIPSCDLLLGSYVDPVPPEEEEVSDEPLQRDLSTTCPKCSTVVDDKRPTCPNCGFMLKTRKVGGASSEGAQG